METDINVSQEIKLEDAVQILWEAARKASEPVYMVYRTHKIRADKNSTKESIHFLLQLKSGVVQENYTEHLTIKSAIEGYKKSVVTLREHLEKFESVDFNDIVKVTWYVHKFGFLLISCYGQADNLRDEFIRRMSEKGYTEKLFTQAENTNANENEAMRVFIGHTLYYMNHTSTYEYDPAIILTTVSTSMKALI